MLTDYPAPLYPTNSGAVPVGGTAPATREKGLARGLWRYQATERRRSTLVLALIASAGLHGAAFLFIGPTKEPGPRVIVNDTPTIELTMPKLEDLEEPERATTDTDEPVEANSFVPTQADLPQVPQPSDFIQKIDFNSLVERPDMSAAKVFAVPDNINRGAAIRQSIGTVFNIADLDRVPEALVRPPPIFPSQYKHDVMQATVRVQFIVDSNGQVVHAFVVESSHSGFNDAAVVGVNKWKFRPGIKNGRRVNTRMEVPIVFTLSDE